MNTQLDRCDLCGEEFPVEELTYRGITTLCKECLKKVEDDNE